MSTERDRFLKGLSNVAREERRTSFRPALIKGRRNEASTDLSQLPVGKVLRLSNDQGDFAFVPGYSIIGGPDVLS